MIALLCPSYKRPQQFKRMLESVAKTADTEVQVFLCVGPDDVRDYPTEGVHVMVAPDWLPTAHKWNLLAEEAIRKGASLLMLAADDIVFATPGWDAALRGHYERLENKIHVYSLLDSRDENGTPHIIATAEYVEAMGFFVPPIFLHWKIDTWTVSAAQETGCFTHFKDYLLIHDKPSDRGVADETHSRIRLAGWHSRDEYVAKTCLDWLELQRVRLAKCLKN